MADRVGTEALCRSGPDFVGIDCQHGFFAFEQAATSIQVANLCQVPCFVRVTADQLDWVPRYLDAGADGIVVAMVSSPEEVRRAVRLSRYQPAGRRSYGGGKRNGVGEVPGAGPEAPEVLPMIETAEALASLEEIAEVPGVTGLVGGPSTWALLWTGPLPYAATMRPGARRWPGWSKCATPTACEAACSPPTPKMPACGSRWDFAM